MSARATKSCFLCMALGAWFVHSWEGAKAAPESPPAKEAPKAGAKVELKSAKYADLDRAVKAQRGKVVVVDIWADFCVPCKKDFPHLVKMHRTHAKDGLVCFSVSVDDERTEGALKFLTKQQATFTNYWLDEKAEAWQDRWNIKGPPAVLVYDRRGRLARQFDREDPRKQYTPADVERLVLELLRAPAP